MTTNATAEIRRIWKPERDSLAKLLRDSRQQIPQAILDVRAGRISRDGIAEVVQSLRGQVRGTWGTPGFSHKSNLKRMAQLRIREAVLRRAEALPL